MSPQRPQPRRSQLGGLHPAIPPTEETDTKPAIPGQEPGQPSSRSFRVTHRQGPPTQLPLTDRRQEPAEPEPSSRSEKMTINIPAALINEAKDAYWVDRGSYRTFSEWIAEALQRQIQDTMTRHGLEQLPTRPARGLPPGRPLS